MSKCIKVGKQGRDESTKELFWFGAFAMLFRTNRNLSVMKTLED